MQKHHLAKAKMATMESKLKIKAVQTVIPMKPTNTRQPLPISISENVGSSIYKTSLNLVFCYNKFSEEHESGSLVAGWIKESLAMALSQQPILAGRLRKKDDGVVNEGEMEIVPNDSGIRLIEAQIDVSLKEFLDLKNKQDYEDALVFWKDIDHEIPQFSPLVYIQVTSFSCSGYSIGISCSLILIDPLSLINFLKTWINIHLKLISNSQNTPLFYRPNHDNIYPSLNQSIGPTSKRACKTQTAIFNIEILISSDNKTHKNIAEFCINEAEKMIGIKPKSSRNVLLIIKESIEDDIKIRRFDKEEIIGGEKPFFYKNGKFGDFDDLMGDDDDDISFSKDCKPTYCSWWIKLDDDDDEAVVMVIPSLEIDGSRMKIIAALPIEK